MNDFVFKRVFTSLINLFPVDAAQASSLGSEGEDEAGLWSLELQDCPESLDKTSLTPSEGTEEPSSPTRSMQPLSPGHRSYWGQAEPDALEDSATPSATDRERDQEPPRMYCKLIPNSRCDLLEISAIKAAKQHKIRDSCVSQLYCFSFLMQHLSGFMMLLETPSYQLLLKPCLLCKLFLFFLFFTLLFEKTPF